VKPLWKWLSGTALGAFLALALGVGAWQRSTHAAVPADAVPFRDDVMDHGDPGHHHHSHLAAHHGQGHAPAGLGDHHHHPHEHPHPTSRHHHHPHSH
jgi:hypothetical protein